MAFRRRFVRTSSSFRRRPKPQGAWTGLAITSVTLSPNVTSSFYVWSDLDSQRLNMAGRGVHQRTLLWLAWSPGDQSSPFHFAWSLNVYETDAANAVPASAILRPVNDALSLFEKSPLDWGYRFVMPNFGASVTGGAGNTLTRDIKVKRRMDDTSALMLALEYSPVTGTSTQRFSLFARTYVTW